MQLVTRAQWGARPPRNRVPLIRLEQKGTAVHYSASDADEQALHANCARRVRAIQDFHMDGRGWSDIAYSYLTCKHGFVYEGRGRGTRTAAQGTNQGNDAYHAVCFLGDDTANRDDVTAPGRVAIHDAVIHCNAWAGVDDVQPHSHFHATGCPGDDLRAWIAAGMPIQDEEDDDMGLSADDKQWLSTKLEASERRTARYVDHGNVDQPGSDDHHERIRADLATLTAALGARLDAIEELLTKPPEPPA